MAKISAAGPLNASTACAARGLAWCLRIRGKLLNPVKTIGAQVGEILRLHQKSSAAARKAQVLALLTKVGLSHPEQRIDQYPHQLSGGMKQRVLIAIAIALKPDLIIADEPTSALDVTIQKRILDLLDTLPPGVRHGGTVRHPRSGAGGGTRRPPAGLSPRRDSGTGRDRRCHTYAAAYLYPPAAERSPGFDA
ncbi:ABC transporter ATP-binding protein [Klebsiella michiganensis]|nr:ABC transporter ATP-binding protein [Klebsiella michiganensis]